LPDAVLGLDLHVVHLLLALVSALEIKTRTRVQPGNTKRRITAIALCWRENTKSDLCRGLLEVQGLAVPARV
jgi:hypothetical protein